MEEPGGDRLPPPCAALETTDALLPAFEVAPVDETVTAQRARCVALVTANPRDFRGSPVRVLTPIEAAAWLLS